MAETFPFAFGPEAGGSLNPMEWEDTWRRLNRQQSRWATGGYIPSGAGAAGVEPARPWWETYFQQWPAATGVARVPKPRVETAYGPYGPQTPADQPSAVPDQPQAPAAAAAAAAPAPTAQPVAPLASYDPLHPPGSLFQFPSYQQGPVPDPHGQQAQVANWLSQVKWGEIGGKVAAPLLIAALFGGNKYKDLAAGQTADLSALAQGLAGQGQQIAGRGQEALEPVMQYLMQLVGGDPVALAQATAPERARVLDQYDTARKAVQFAPRGASAGAVAQMGAQQAGQLAVLPMDARRSAVSTLGTLGKGLVDTGVLESRAAADALAEAARSYNELAARQGVGLNAMGTALGTAIPAILQAFGIP